MGKSRVRGQIAEGAADLERLYSSGIGRDVSHPVELDAGVQILMKLNSHGLGESLVCRSSED